MCDVLGITSVPGCGPACGAVCVHPSSTGDPGRDTRDGAWLSVTV